MTTRIGKIGRLPKTTRDELGRRIEDNELGADIVFWLNGQDDVKRILAEQFEGRAITEQNLSHWKQTGHLDWLRLQETRDSARLLMEQADALDEVAPLRDLGERLARVLAAEMARLASALLEQETDPEKRWQRLCQINRELSQLRRQDDRAIRTAIRQERWEAENRRLTEEEEARKKKEAAERMIAKIKAPDKIQDLTEIYGGDAKAARIAPLLYSLRNDLPCDDSIEAINRDFAEPPPPAEPAPATPQSKRKTPVKPNKSKAIKHDRIQQIIADFEAGILESEIRKSMAPSHEA
jgi:hypothetical protein